MEFRVKIDRGVRYDSRSHVASGALTNFHEINTLVECQDYLFLVEAFLD